MVNAKFNKKWVKSGSLKNSNFALALIILTILSSVFTSGGSYAASRLKTRPTKTVLVPIPRYGFDPTEVAVPWKYLKAAGHRIVFATPDGTQGRADERMVSGRDLGILASVLMASAAGVQAYRELEKSPEFRNPISYDQIRVDQMDALFLPGGHDKGMREYLESKVLQQAVVQFFDLNKPVGAICHGTLLAGRSISPKTGKSVLWERKTTGLTQLQELTAFNLTRAYLGDYYRTYPKIAMEDDLKSYLRDPSQFDRGPGFPVPVSRDSMIDLRPGFTILDRNYLSARWPGDAHRFGRDFVQLLTQGGAGGAGQRTYYLSPKNFKGLRLRVGEFIPAGPIVGDILYLTGFADRLDNHGPLFDTWTKAGFRVVSFDYPSHGDTYGNGNNLDLFSIRNLGELAAFVENSTRVDRNRPLYLAG